MFTNREKRILLKQKMRTELCALNFVHAIKRIMECSTFVMKASIILIGSKSFPESLMSVGWLVVRLVRLHNFLIGREITLHAPVEALVFFFVETHFVPFNHECCCCCCFCFVVVKLMIPVRSSFCLYTCINRRKATPTDNTLTVRSIRESKCP